ncbi:hypothetical protein HPB47_004173, partial [Ixodes persulcatus]
MEDEDLRLVKETTGASTSAAVPRPRSLLEALQDLPEEERENLLEQLKRIMTREAIGEIERLTRAQASSSHWMLYRRGMATASICRGFFTRAKSLKTQPRPHNLRGLLDKVLQVSTFQSASMKRGQQKEGTVKEKYLSKLVTDGHCPRIENSGLVIWEQMQIMGGSPDGIVVFECECCRGKRVLLEVKCPEVLQNSFCQKTGEPQYVYYTQMQCVCSHDPHGCEHRITDHSVLAVPWSSGHSALQLNSRSVERRTSYHGHRFMMLQ